MVGEKGLGHEGKCPLSLNGVGKNNGGCSAPLRCSSEPQRCSGVMGKLRHSRTGCRCASHLGTVTRTPQNFGMGFLLLQPHN